MTELAAGRYDKLSIYRYRARFRPREDLLLPRSGGSALLRGAFGITLRRLVCHDMKLACRLCPLRQSCPYPAVFDPGARADEPQLLRYADPPRPFVLRPANPNLAERVRVGEEFALDLHLIGAAQQQAPYLLATLNRLAEDGLGPRRARLTLDRVEALDALGETSAVALDPLAATMRPTAAPALCASALLRPGDTCAQVLRVRYVSPTLLRERGEILAAPRFGALARRLRARIGALATLFGAGPLEDDPRVIEGAADEVATQAEEIHFWSETRRSSRTGQRHPLQGLVGEATYRGALAEFVPLLRLGELVHVGKHASFGLGRIAIDVE